MNFQEVLSIQFKNECTEQEWQWLQHTLSSDLAGRKLGFVMAHRHIARDNVSSGTIPVSDNGYELSLTTWTRDQLARTILLLSMYEGSISDFQETISSIFLTSDNRESQAIYAAIALFPDGPAWKFRATEAIRSNVGLIFDAMAFNNPYPAIYFEDPAWNQLVLKTIFGNKSIWRITGLAHRRNAELARAISDFAHERWAAGRTLPPEVWFLTEPYVNDGFWQDAGQLFSSENPVNHTAAYLLWKNHANTAPKEFTRQYNRQISELETQNPTWESVVAVLS